MFTNCYDQIVSDELKLRLIEKVNGDMSFDLLPYYYFDILDNMDNHVGKISFRLGFNEYSIYNGNIGYEINPNYRGNNYSLKATKMLKPLFKFHNHQTIVIVVDIDNNLSNKIAYKAKGKLIGQFKVDKNHKFFLKEETIKNVYLLTVSDL